MVQTAGVKVCTLQGQTQCCDHFWTYGGIFGCRVKTIFRACSVQLCATFELFELCVWGGRDIEKRRALNVSLLININNNSTSAATQT